VEELLSSHELVFAEVYHTFGQVLRAKAAAKGVDISSVFLIPADLGSGAEEITAIMRRKLDLRDMDNEDKKKERSTEAPAEMVNAIHYSHILLNTAGEDDVDEWGEFGRRLKKPGTKAVNSLDDLGPTARWLVQTFVGILDGRIPEGVHRPPSVAANV
jgi:hypothetical protein